MAFGDLSRYGDSAGRLERILASLDPARLQELGVLRPRGSLHHGSGLQRLLDSGLLNNRRTKFISGLQGGGAEPMPLPGVSLPPTAPPPAAPQPMPLPGVSLPPAGRIPSGPIGAAVPESLLPSDPAERGAGARPMPLPGVSLPPAGGGEPQQEQGGGTRDRIRDRLREALRQGRGQATSQMPDKAPPAAAAPPMPEPVPAPAAPAPAPVAPPAGAQPMPLPAFQPPQAAPAPAAPAFDPSGLMGRLDALEQMMGGWDFDSIISDLAELKRRTPDPSQGGPPPQTPGWGYAYGRQAARPAAAPAPAPAQPAAGSGGNYGPFAGPGPIPGVTPGGGGRGQPFQRRRRQDAQPGY